MFGHSSYGNEWNCHGRGQVPDRYGTVHRPIASVLLIAATTGPGSGCRPAWGLKWRFRASSQVRRKYYKIRRFHSLRIFCGEFSEIDDWSGYIKSDFRHQMQKLNSIIMRAPRASIFESAANLELW